MSFTDKCIWEPSVSVLPVTVITSLCLPVCFKFICCEYQTQNVVTWDHRICFRRCKYQDVCEMHVCFPCLRCLFRDLSWNRVAPHTPGSMGGGFCLSHHNTFCISIMIERSTLMLYILAAHLEAGWCSGSRFRLVTTQQVRRTDGEGGAQNLGITGCVFAGHRPGRRQMLCHPSRLPKGQMMATDIPLLIFYFFRP